MRQIGIVQSLQVGMPQQYGVGESEPGKDQTWTTSFVRTPDPRPRRLYVTHLEGNSQADTKNHGQPDQAVLLYALAHYVLWQEEIDRPDIGAGGFGENLTVAGLSEANTCVGDTYGLGEARLQVSGPRYPCSKIDRRWRRPGLRALVAASGRTGWYCRVLREGTIAPGLPILLVERPYPQWTVALVNELGHQRRDDAEASLALASCPLLNPWWQDLLRRRALGQPEE